MAGLLHSLVMSRMKAAMTVMSIQQAGDAQGSVGPRKPEAVHVFNPVHSRCGLATSRLSATSAHHATLCLK